MTVTIYVWYGITMKEQIIKLTYIYDDAIRVIRASDITGVTAKVRDGEYQVILKNGQVYSFTRMEYAWVDSKLGSILDALVQMAVKK